MDQVFHVEIEAFVCVVTEAWYVGTVATANNIGGVTANNIWGVMANNIWGVTAKNILGVTADNIWGVTADNIWGVNLSCKAPVAP